MTHRRCASNPTPREKCRSPPSGSGGEDPAPAENFKIGHDRMPLPLIHAPAQVKLRSSTGSTSPPRLQDPTIGRAIIAAADEVFAGQHDAEFPLVVLGLQTGSGRR